MGRSVLGQWGRICAVAAAPSARRMIAQIKSALHETRTIELRLDWLVNDRERRAFLQWLRANRWARVNFLATCRRRAGGGQFEGTIKAELDWLSKAREAGCAWCDLEIETLRSLPGRPVGELGLPPHVLLSLHDFRITPALPRWTKELSSNGIDAIKVAAQARTIADSVRMLRLAHSSKPGSRVVVSMGEVGLPARILALREGSALAYAPIEQATAPGQVSLHELKHLYRADRLSRRTKIFGVIGNPIGHSLSPLLHNTGFAARRIDAVYLPFLVQNLRDFLEAVPEFGLGGFSATLPHKTNILEHLTECEPLAADIGAVNTVVVRRNGSLYGCNTDYIGVLHSLQKRMRLPESRVLILGAGGSARAAAFALVRQGATVSICARRESEARQLARVVGGEAVPRRALRTEHFDAMLNATPVGMHPATGVSPLEPRELNCRIVMDLIYRPEKTQLLKIAERKGIATVSGVEMFLAQGIAQWELWMKRRAPEAAMRRAVQSALQAEESHGKSAPRRSR